MIGYGLGSERITPAALWVEGVEAEAGGLVGGLGSGVGQHLTGLRFASLVPAHGMWRKGRDLLPPGQVGHSLHGPCHGRPQRIRLVLDMVSALRHLGEMWVRQLCQTAEPQTNFWELCVTDGGGRCWWGAQYKKRPRTGP